MMSKFKPDWRKVNFVINCITLILVLVFGILILNKPVIIKENIEYHTLVFPGKVDTIKVTRGLASYYGDRYHGKLTANGETFDKNLLTCASNFLPFNTKLKVTNMLNNKSVIVKVNDRGPFKCPIVNNKFVPPFETHPTRVLDLSEQAMVVLEGIHQGIIPIEYEILN